MSVLRHRVGRCHRVDTRTTSSATLWPPPARCARCCLLGLAPAAGNYETVWTRIQRLGIDGSHLRRRRVTRVISTATDEDVASAVQRARSVAQALQLLGAGAGGRRLLLGRIEALGLDVGHLRGQGWRRGDPRPPVPARPLDQVLVDGHHTNTSRLKRRLIQAGLKRRRCERCQRERWNGRPIPLELDHIDGRRENNLLENLQLLCPNCHAQTSTYRGRNIGVRGYAAGPGPGGGKQTHRP